MLTLFGDSGYFLRSLLTYFEPNGKILGPESPEIPELNSPTAF
jgi:hypothetical protein